MSKLTDKEFIDSLTEDEKKLIKAGKFEEFLKNTKNKTIVDDLFSMPMLKSSLQGPTLGFADEIYGGVRAGLSGDLDNYEKFRDKYRAETKRFEERRPVLSTAGQVATSLPFLFLKPFQGAQATRAYMAANPLKTTAGVGAVGGATAGAGFSERDFDLSDPQFQKDVALGAGTGFLLNPAMQKAQTALSPYATRLGNYFRNTDKTAKRAIMQQLARDQDTVEGISGKMGEKGVFGVSGGPNLYSLFDSVVSQPGKTSPRVKNLVDSLKDERYDLMQEKLKTGILGNILGDMEPDEFITKYTTNAKTKASPIYDELKRDPIELTPELKDVINRAKGIGGTRQARELASVSKDYTYSLSDDIDTLDMANFSDLQTLKESLFDLAQNLKDKPKLSKEIDKTRRELVSILDNQTKLKENKTIGGIEYKAGDSLYKNARDIWAGAEEFASAKDQGFKAFDTGATAKSLRETRNMVQAMNESEKEAFFVGAFEALEDKLKFKVGENELLKVADIDKGGIRGVREKFAQLFGGEASDEMKNFVKFINTQVDLKNLERLGKGSQTASRLAVKEEAALDPARMAVRGYQLLKGDVISPTLDYIIDKSKTTASLPEKVRDRIGEYALMGPEIKDAGFGRVLPDVDEEARQAMLNRLARTNVLQFGLLQPTVQDF